MALPTGLEPCFRREELALADSRCFATVHRGPLDGCYPVYGYYAGYGGGYRNNYYTGFNSGGVCSGRGTYLACNPYGICWVACN
jgi:hypothetical protein